MSDILQIQQIKMKVVETQIMCQPELFGILFDNNSLNSHIVIIKWKWNSILITNCYRTLFSLWRKWIITKSLWRTNKSIIIYTLTYFSNWQYKFQWSLYNIINLLIMISAKHTQMVNYPKTLHNKIISICDLLTTIKRGKVNYEYLCLPVVVIRLNLTI